MTKFDISIVHTILAYFTLTGVLSVQVCTQRFISQRNGAKQINNIGKPGEVLERRFPYFPQFWCRIRPAFVGEAPANASLATIASL